MQRRNYFLLITILIFEITVLWVGRVRADSTNDFYDNTREIIEKGAEQRQKSDEEYRRRMKEIDDKYWERAEKIIERSDKTYDDYTKGLEKINVDFERRMDKLSDNRREERKINILENLSFMGWVVVGIVCIFLVYKYKAQKKDKS